MRSPLGEVSNTFGPGCAPSSPRDARTLAAQRNDTVAGYRGLLIRHGMHGRVARRPGTAQNKHIRFEDVEMESPTPVKLPAVTPGVYR